MELGRPTTYTQEIADEICERLSNGESLRKICRDDHMPQESTVRGWVIYDRENFYAQYTKAREIQAMRWAEEILEISDDPAERTMEGKIDTGDVNHKRLRVDTRKWLLSKVLPKVYGDKLDLTSAGEKVGLSININLGDEND